MEFVFEIINPEAATRGILWEMFLEISQNPQEKNQCQSLF